MKLKLQQFGGRGQSNPRGGGSGKAGGGGLVGKRVTDLGITSDNIESKLGLSKLSTGQKNALVNMFRGMEKNDHSYDEKGTPFEIQRMSITQPVDNVVSVSIITGGNTGREIVDMLDKRYRGFLIGKNGGVYTYSKNGKRKQVSGYDVMHGTLEP